MARQRLSVTMPEVQGSAAVAFMSQPDVAPEVEYQTMPPLAADELEALERSILAHGIQVPVIVDERGVLIDGHHRKKIADRHGIEVPTRVRAGLSEADKVALSISLNIDRRQLSREQRREIIARSLKADPVASNREHARRTGADDKTVADERRKLESSAELPQLDKTRGADGRERTTTPTRPAAPEPRPVETKHVIERAVADVEALALRTVDLSTADLPADRAADWARRLSVSITTLRAFAHLIEGQS